MTSSGCGGRETTRWAGIPDRAAGRRSGSPLRRDDGAGVERRGPLEAAAHGRAVGLEGPRDEHKRRSCPARPDDAEGGAGPRQASRTAGERKTRVHILRHTFCSHLAMRGAPARAIQAVAGTRTFRPRSGTCTSVQQRSRTRSACWTSRSGAGGETGGRRTQFYWCSNYLMVLRLLS